MTHTYAVLEVSQSTYDEVKRLLAEAGWGHAFHDGLVDMYGISLGTKPEVKPAKVRQRRRAT